MEVPVTQLRKGVLFKSKGEVFAVLKYEHIKMARGRATIKVKARSIRTGAIRKLSFSSGLTVEEVSGHKKNFEFVFLNERNKQLVLAEPETHQRIQVPLSVVDESKVQFLKEGGKVTGLVLDEDSRPDGSRIVELEVPVTVTLRVEMTGPSEKGDTVTGGTKPATLETGAIVSVPMFIKNGDTIKVNTVTKEYVERV